MDKKPNKNKTGLFSRFNDALSYFLVNIFKFIFVIVVFAAKISGLILITFPFILLGLCVIAPETANKTLEAIKQLIQLIVNIFKEVS